MAGPFGSADDAGGPGRAQLEELEEELEQELKKTAGDKTDAQADGRGGL